MHPARFEYRLTDMGRDYYQVLLALKQWGDTWLAEEEGPPVTLTHATCGLAVSLVLTCSDRRRGHRPADDQIAERVAVTSAGPAATGANASG